MSDVISNTPAPPYYAVIFTSIMQQNTEGYAAMAKQMEILAKEQEGFLGMESSRNEIGITVSYWNNLESIRIWKQHSDHVIAQQFGKERWYESYKVRIAKVERDYLFDHKLDWNGTKS